MHRTERGTSLIEIILAIVIMGVVSSALMAAISTSANGSAAHRNLVTGDAVLRNYAEAVKTAVRTNCPSVGTWTATYPNPPGLPTGFTVNSLTAQACPAATATATVTLDATMPNGVVKHLSIKVRTP